MKNAIKLILAPALLMLWLFPINSMAGSNSSTSTGFNLPNVNEYVTKPSILADLSIPCREYRQSCSRVCGLCYYCAKGKLRNIECTDEFLDWFKKQGYWCIRVHHCRRVCKDICIR